MRRTILCILIALIAVGAANHASAQRRDGAGHGFARGGHAFGHARSSYSFHRARGNNAYSRARAISLYGSSYAYMPYDSGVEYADASGPGSYPPQPVVFVQQPPVLIQPSAPPAAERPAEPVIKEYKWPAASTASSHTESETQFFAIVLKDGSTLSALTIFASDDGLHYVDPDERHLFISMSEINRPATLSLNRARDLNLYLPAPE